MVTIKIITERDGELAEQVVYRVISGNVDDGIWNGNVLWQFEEADGSTKSFPVSFDNGKWMVLRYEWDGTAIVCERENGNGDYMGINPEKKDDILGIIGFASDY